MSKKRSLASAGRLIKTKLGPPRPARRIVRREDLARVLALGAERALTLLRAPAGFGKTTVLADWREQMLMRRAVVAWLTLDADDNDPAHFGSYVVRAVVDALQDSAADVSQLRVEAEMASPRILFTSLINVLEQIGEPVSLILDDYDRIHAAPVHELVSFLLLHAPANLHVIIAARSEPPLPLAYLRAQDELVEIDATGLRFSIEHTQSFLADVASLGLSADQVRRLHDATEGWVAGLQIASIGLRGCDDADARIESFSGYVRAVNEYLSQVVLPSISEADVAFLLRTSIVERLSGPLCDHLVGGSGGQRTLERLNSDNLFLLALDDEGRWFRHHALFADFLRKQLAQRMPEEFLLLNLRAAQWFAEQGLWSEAVRHALAAEQVELATDWVERCAMREVEDSHVRRLLAWVGRLPEEAVRRRPRLRIAAAWALLLTIQLDEAMVVIEGIEADLASAVISGADAGVDTEAELLSLRFCITALKDDTAAALPLGERFLSLLQPPERIDQGRVWAVQAALNGLSHCYQKAGLIAQARRCQRPEVYPMPRDSSRNLFTHSYRACLLSACDVREGQLQQGAAKLRQGLAFAESHAGRRSAAATLVACSLAALFYEWNRLDELDQLLAGRLDIVDDACYLDSVRSAYLALVRTAIVRGEFEAAHALLDRAEIIGARRGWPRLLAVCSGERVRLLIAENRITDAQRELARMDTFIPGVSPAESSAASESWRVNAMAHAGWLLHEQRSAEAVDVLRRLLAEQDGARNSYLFVRTRLLLVRALMQDGRRDEALDLLVAQIAFATSLGLVRSVIDEPRIGALLQQALDERSDTVDREACLRFMALAGVQPVEEPARTAAPVTRPALKPAAAAALAEPLSARERDVLELIAQGLSNKQAARALMLGTETVKWHLKNVYSKLGVERRTLAVHRARQMDLIPKGEAI